MSRPVIVPTGRESKFDDDEIIVTKTDLKGRITYANDVFLRVSRIDQAGVIGKPHNLIRHPDMPACVFKLMWDTLGAGNEIFVYVVNLATNGDHYWVFANVTLSFDAAGAVIGFHSYRRKPDSKQVAAISAVYRPLREIELRAADPKEGMRRSGEALLEQLNRMGVSYDAFVHTL